MHLNINGIQNKAQVFFLTETKINATYPTAQFKISGYEIYHNDRTNMVVVVLRHLYPREHNPRN